MGIGMVVGLADVGGYSDWIYGSQNEDTLRPNEVYLKGTVYLKATATQRRLGMRAATSSRTVW